MLANSVAFVMTFIVEHLMKHERLRLKDLTGLGLVLCGLYICMFSKGTLNT